jgi:hydrogenase expression/formation protein HypC
MCLAIPGKIESIDLQSDPRMAKVNFGGIIKNVCLEFMPEANVNDYVLVHVGMAISKVDEEEALETLRMFAQMGNSLDELNEGESA